MVNSRAVLTAEIPCGASSAPFSAHLTTTLNVSLSCDRMSRPTATAEISAPWFHRAFAGLAVALLLLLTVSAGSPALHHWLHGEAGHETNDNCAVVLMVSGIVLATATIVVAAPRLSWNEFAPPSVEEIFLTAPRYLRQPERGPPFAG